MVDVVNVVATGDLGKELDLSSLSANSNVYQTQYEPEIFPGVVVRLADNGPVVLIFSTGTYTMTGISCVEKVEQTFEEFVDKLNIDVEKSESYPTIQNLVCKGDFGREIDLEPISVELGLDNIEYNIEKSPFLYYWPDRYDCLMTMHTNGEVVVTGIRNTEDAERAFDSLHKKIDSLFDNSTENRHDRL